LGVSRPGRPRALPALSPLAARWLWLAALALAWALPLYLPSPYVLTVLTTALTYIILALGLNIVVGYAGLFHVGHAALFGLAAYTAGYLNVHFGWSFWLTMVAAGLAAGGAGALLALPLLRLRFDYVAVATMAFAFIFVDVAQNWTEVTGGSRGLAGVSPIDVWLPSVQDGLHFTRVLLLQPWQHYLVAFGLMLVALYIARTVEDSRLGQQLMAIREDEDAAASMGIDTVRVKVVAFMLGSFIAGLAGAFFAARYSAITARDFGGLESIYMIIMVIIGGMASIPGVILGAVAMIVLPELLRDLQTYRFLLFGAGIVLMMVFRPEGLIPSRIRRRELHREPAGRPVQAASAPAPAEAQAAWRGDP
jgi:branched-chain amino acid transport system permease protein